MSNWRLAVVAVGAAVSVGAAQAAYVLDTGPGTGGATSVALQNLANGFTFQNLGVTFNVAQASSITSVEGWINTLQAGDVRFELRQGANPNGATLFSSVASISGAAGAWHGATGLDWDVAAGDYTLALIAVNGFSGGMEVSPPTPAGAEWVDNPLTGGWTPTTFNMGWRVGAEVNSVPEPGSLALIAVALAGLGLATLRRRPTD